MSQFPHLSDRDNNNNNSAYYIAMIAMRLKGDDTCSVLRTPDVIHPSLMAFPASSPTSTALFSLSLSLPAPSCWFVCAWFGLIWSDLTTAASALGQLMPMTGTASLTAKA